VSDKESAVKKPLYLIDSYALIYRSYFAFINRPLRNAKGENISSLFGFAKLLVSLLDETAGKGREILLAAVFDSKTPTFRKQKYPPYKATRQKAPQDLHSQVPKVEELLKRLGIKTLAADSYEADDIIATLAARAKSEGRECFIVSGDKDLLQLVGDGVMELRPSKNASPKSAAPGPDAADRGRQGGIPNYDIIGPEDVKAEWGVSTNQILDFLSLTGDASDNVPGVKGIGEKTAVRLLQKYRTLDEIYKNLAGIEGAAAKKLAAGREDAFLSRELITLVETVPLAVTDLEELSLARLDREAGASYLLEEEIPSIAKQLGAGKPGGEARPASHDGTPRTPPAPSASAQDSQAAFPELAGDGSYKAILSLDELKDFFDRAKRQGYFALDFETDSLDAWRARPVGISFALKPKEAFYVPLAPEGELSFSGAAGEGKQYPGQSEVKKLLFPLLQDGAMTIIAHNAKYDYEVSRAWGAARWKAKIYDTMVAAWLCDSERSSYSLDSFANYFSYSPVSYDSVVPKGGTFADVPLETAVAYSCEDADLTMRLKAVLDVRLRELFGSGSLFSTLEMPLLPVLAEMEGAGIMIERSYLLSYGTELAGELEQIQNETWKEVGHEFNLASPRQLQEVLFAERNLKPVKKTKTGWSTDVAVLEELAGQDIVPELILKHRTLSKLKSTYIDALANQADGEGRVHTSFIQTGTATGRLSSRDPNLQNIPVREEAGRRIRRAFIAAPGHLLISADYSQIELVVLAHLSADANLCPAFREGKDIHLRTASLIFGLPEDEVSDAQRRIAKTINFGVIYGMSAFRLAAQLKTGRREAAAFIEAYFNTYSGVRAFMENLIRQTEETGFVSTIFGRRRRIPAINSRNKTEKAAAERVAVNTPVQGSAADIVKKAMLDVDAALGQSGLQARMLLQVHDELILECPQEEVPAAVTLIRSVMENAVSLSVPLRVSIESAPRWGDLH